MKILQRLVFLLFAFSSVALAQVHSQKWKNIVNQKEGAWFASDTAKMYAENVLLYQRDIGGWPKNTQMQKPLTEVEKAQLLEDKSDSHGCTTDNGATFLEMTFLSKVYRQQPDERYKVAFLKALDYLLEAQYDNGGWPQFYPLKKGYATHITYNDDSMEHIMEILRDLFKKTDRFSIKPDDATLARCKTAFDKGIDIIIKTQYKQNGVLTAWCAQHDELTLEPAKARAYELPSLSGQESVGLTLLLMSLDNPSPEVKLAVNSAAAWFEKTKITGFTVVSFKNANGKKDKRVEADPNAEPMWGRFMELEDNRPFFCGRDGIKKYKLEEIEQERRGGYGWYTDSPEKVLKRYPKWKAKWQNAK